MFPRRSATWTLCPRADAIGSVVASARPMHRSRGPGHPTAGQGDLLLLLPRPHYCRGLTRERNQGAPTPQSLGYVQAASQTAAAPRGVRGTRSTVAVGIIPAFFGGLLETDIETFSLAASSDGGDRHSIRACSSGMPRIGNPSCRSRQLGEDGAILQSPDRITGPRPTDAVWVARWCAGHGTSVK